MSRNVRCGLIQASNALGSNRSLPEIKKAMIDKHLKLIEQAAKKKVKILCLQELFYGPYFCAEQNIRWYDLTERVPDGPTTQLMQKIAAKHSMVMVVPVYEEQMPGLYFNTAAVIDADGKYLASTASTTSRTYIRDSGRNFISLRATWAIPSSKRSTLASECTSAMTVIFRKARASSD